MKKYIIAIIAILGITLCAILVSSSTQKGYSTIDNLVNAYVSGMKSGDIDAIEKCFYPAMVNNYSLNRIDSRSYLYGKWEKQMNEYDLNTFYTIDNQYAADANATITVRHELQGVDIQSVTIVEFVNNWFGFSGNDFFANGLHDDWYVIKTNGGYYIFCDQSSDYAKNNDLD